MSPDERIVSPDSDTIMNRLPPRKTRLMRRVFLVLFTLAVCALVFSLTVSRRDAQQARGGGGCPGEMALVPGGGFTMGSSRKTVDYLIKFCENLLGNCDPAWFTAEMPQHTASVPSFCMDRYEYPDKKDSYPLTGVTWQAADQVCKAQGKQLCSEEMFERACTGGDGRAWAYGNRYVAGACAISANGITPSGSHPKCASPVNVFDLSGNVAEWTASKAPGDNGPDDYRIVRGGSFRDGPLFTRCAFRDMYPPTARYDQIGFRCCIPLAR